MSLRAGAGLARRHLAPHRRAVAMLVAWSAVEAVPVFASGLVVAAAIDRGFLADRVAVGLGWLSGLAVLYLVAAFAARQLYRSLAGTIEPLRDSLVTALTTAFLERATAGASAPDGATVTQATEQVETVRELLADLLRNARQLVAVAVAALGGLTALSPLLAAMIAPMVLLALGGFVWLLRVLVTRQRDVILSEEAITGTATPVVNGLRDVVACAAEERAADSVAERTEAQAEAVRRFARARVIRVLLLTVGVHLPLLALLAAAPWLLAQGYVTVGVIGGAVIYVSQQLEPAFRFLVNAAGTWVVILGVVLGRLSQATSRRRDPPAQAAELPAAGYGIDASQVTFAYSPDAEPVIRDLSLEVPRGAHLAVVGPSGVGKSTLADVLTGLATPQRGEVRLGGVPLEQVDERELRRRIALIPQEAYIFTGTVADNLAYLHPEATRAQLDEVVELIGLAETIARLGGYDAEIAPGGEDLSAGERQLIALARVFLSPAEVVILDEGTSHLDPVAEGRAERAFADRHGTLVVIAHRISSALRADRILLMDGGEVALGSHQTLLATRPLYADLVGHWEALPEHTRSSPPGGTPEKGSAPRAHR